MDIKNDDSSENQNGSDRRKDDNENLESCEERYETLFKTMKHGVVYQDADGKIIAANPAAERILGLDIDQMTGRTSVDPRWRAVKLDKTDFPGEEHPSMVSLRTGKTVEDVVMGVFNPKDNRYHWLNVTAIPLFESGEERPYQVYTTFEDITEKQEIEEELMEKEFAITSSIYPIAFSDYRGKITFANNAMLKMWGYESHDEVIGRSVLEFWKDSEEIRELQSKVMEGKGGFGEFVAERKDGSTFVALVSVGPIKSDSGEIKSIMASCIDITDTKHMEIERARQKRELELYASILKHDIGNDLQLLLSHIESLDSRFSKGEVEYQEKLVPIKESIFRMSKLLNTLGEYRDNEELTLPLMLESISKTAEKIYDGMTVNIHVEEDVSELQTSGFLFLHIVFENLIRNSAQYAKDKPEVNINVRRANGDAIIDFADNGEGIPVNLKDKLFQKGTSSNGSGLGLYLARQILNIYNGTIELLESKENEGARFRIVVPLQPSLST